jgi:rfaE bifunctional protein kinase chain/domain
LSINITTKRQDEVGVKTVLVSGSFNVLHPGHLRLLRFAKEHGDKLIVAVQSDRLAGIGAHVHELSRLECVASVTWVDEAFIFDEPIDEVIARLQPSVLVKGREHESRLNPELTALKMYGGQLVFSSGESVFSSLELIRKEFQGLDRPQITLPSEYMLRHDINTRSLRALLHRLSHLRVCVVGDLIVDEYITCDPLGMSQEDPTIVVTPIDSTQFVGGAGIVAAHAAGLGAAVQFFSVAGRDASRDFALKALARAGVTSQLLVDDGRPTTLKQRYRSKGKTLLRVSHLHQTMIPVDLQAELQTAIVDGMENFDLLVFSDFNYGCLPQSLVDQLIDSAKGFGVMVVADSQSSSQVGDISRFKGMSFLTPTEREARISTRSREDGLVVLAEQLRQLASASSILLKLGEEGLLIHTTGDQHDGWLTDRIPALNSSPRDVAGAGDSLLIASAMALACGCSVWEAACLGSLAAAVQVGRVGNTPLQIDELLRELA